jgi:hypothetical protein
MAPSVSDLPPVSQILSNTDGILDLKQVVRILLSRQLQKAHSFPFNP